MARVKSDAAERQIARHRGQEQAEALPQAHAEAEEECSPDQDQTRLTPAGERTHLRVGIPYGGVRF